MSEEKITAILNRTNVLVDDYTETLDELVNRMVPKTLSNEEYAARCGALMIALNRELARCAATFGETHAVDEMTMMKLVGAQFGKNLALCFNALRNEGAGQTIQ
jgi:hypothetical protein